MITDAARKAVFNTPELLENIISFVPPKEIRTKVQRLSRQWKEAVDSSPAIRGKLWTMFPNTTAVQPTYVTDEHSPPLRSVELGVPVYSHAVTFNPVLFESLVGPLDITSFHQDLQPDWPKTASGGLINAVGLKFCCCKAIDRPHCPAQTLRSSWRDMYLTNPPITTAMVCVSNHSDWKEEFGPSRIRLSVRDHDGLTLGLLYDMLLAGLPSQVREHFGNGDHNNYFISSVHVAAEQLEMGVTSH